MDVEAEGHGNPVLPYSSSFMLDFDFAGITIYSKLIDASLADGWDPDLVREYLQWKPEIWEVEKSKKYEKDFVIAVVPVTISAEASGIIGYDVVAQVCVAKDLCEEGATVPLFQAYTGPRADIEADLSAGVGSSKAGLSAGVGGDISFLSDTFYATTSASLAYDEVAQEIEGTLTEVITNTLTGPNGGLYAYVGYPSIKICRKWGVPYPCGTKTRKKKKYLDKWSSFERKDVLFCDDQATTVVIN
jgi:hypothetical protein